MYQLLQTRASFIAWLLLVFATLTGCGGDSRIGRVQGILTLDGSPVADASVTFMPKEGGKPAFGITDGEGKFSLTTFEKDDGALIGSHHVTIIAVDEKVSDKAEELSEEFGSLTEEMLPNRKPKQIWRVPERYSDVETSGLEYDVVKGPNQADFSLTTKP